MTPPVCSYCHRHVKNKYYFSLPVPGVRGSMRCDRWSCKLLFYPLNRRKIRQRQKPDLFVIKLKLEALGLWK